MRRGCGLANKGCPNGTERGREFIRVLVCGAVARPFGVAAQQSRKLLQVGFLYPGPQSLSLMVGLRFKRPSACDGRRQLVDFMAASGPDLR